MRKPSATNAKKIQAVERQSRILKLRALNYTLEQISLQEGISIQAVHKTIKKYVQKNIDDANQSAEEIRERELQKLALIEQHLWPLVEKRDLNAIAKIQDNIEIRAKLLGLNAPAKQELSTTNGQPIAAFAVPITLNATSWTDAALEQSKIEDEKASQILEG